jgi:hypothetical protein
MTSLQKSHTQMDMTLLRIRCKRPVGVKRPAASGGVLWPRRGR